MEMVRAIEGREVAPIGEQRQRGAELEGPIEEQAVGVDRAVINSNIDFSKRNKKRIN